MYHKCSLHVPLIKHDTYIKTHEIQILKPTKQLCMYLMNLLIGDFLHDIIRARAFSLYFSFIHTYKKNKKKKG